MSESSDVDPSRAYREVLGQYPTGVSAITAQLDDGTLAGMTVGTFTSVSLEPPLVAFFPAVTSTSWPLIERAGKFCVNVLAWDQDVICQRMARPSGDKFTDVSWNPSGLGSPIVDDAVAWIDCTVDSVTEAGDHYIVLGKVHDLQVVRETLPLVFFRGGYGRFSPGPLVSAEFDSQSDSGLLNGARLEMLQLGSELGVESAVTGMVDGHCVMLGSTWTPLSHRARVRVGDRVPIVPPLAVSFVAAGTPELQNEWINAGLINNGGRGRDELQQVLHDSLRRGWSGGTNMFPRETGVRRFLDVNHRLKAGLAADEDFNLSAPIVDERGDVVLSLSIYGMSHQLSGNALQSCIERLMEGARQIEKAIR